MTEPTVPTDTTTTDSVSVPPPITIPATNVPDDDTSFEDGNESPQDEALEPQAQFASATDPATITPPSDPAPVPDPVPDVAATFVPHEAGVPQAVPPTAPVGTGTVTADSPLVPDAGPSTDTNPTTEVVGSPAPSDGSPVVGSSPGTPSTNPTASDVSSVPTTPGPDDVPATPQEIDAKIHETHAMLVNIMGEIASIKVALGDIAPVFEKIIEDGKEKGLAGILPILMSLLKGK